MRLKNMLKLFLTVFVFLFMYLLGRKYCFLKIKISDSYQVRQRPFTKNYALINKNNEILLEHVFEWCDTPEIIFGSGEDYFFILSKKTDMITVYEDTKEYRQFNTDLSLFGYQYSLNSCVRVIDYTMR